MRKGASWRCPRFVPSVVEKFNSHQKTKIIGDDHKEINISKSGNAASETRLGSVNQLQNHRDTLVHFVYLWVFNVRLAQ